MTFSVIANRIHKWAGLVGAIWLAVQAFTGFMQANHDWEWQWSSGPPLPSLTHEHGLENDRFLWRHFQVDPANPDWRMVSGAAGAFVSEDGGQTWATVPFGKHRMKIVNALEIIAGDPIVVIASTTDGVWRLDAGRTRFEPFGLQGKNVTAFGTSPAGELLAVVGRTQLFSASKDDPAWTGIPLGPPPKSMAGKLEVSRFMLDLHNGRGVFGGAIDMTVLRLAGLGLLILALTGPLYWLTMRRSLALKKRTKEQRPSKEAMLRLQSTARWTFRLHAGVVGVALAIPLVVMFVSGAYLGHRVELLQTFRKIEVPLAVQPPVYRPGSWSDQIYGVERTSDGALLFGTRAGMFVSANNGASWARDPGFEGPAMRVRRIGDREAVPGRVLRRIQVRDNGKWVTLKAPHGAVMMSEITAGADGELLFQRADKIFVVGPDGELRGEQTHEPPRLAYMPWALLWETIHTGTMFSKNWKWANDLLALIGLTLVVTGLIRWWKRKW